MTALLTEHLSLVASADQGTSLLRKAILDLAIRGLLVGQDEADEPADTLLQRAVALKSAISKSKSAPESAVNPPYELPRGWVWTTLAGVAMINPRNQARDDHQASFVPMAAIGTGFGDSHSQEVRRWGDIKTGFTHFAEGDIGVAKITPCFENSKACVFSGLINGIGAGTTELHVVRPLGGTLAPRYVLAYLKSPWFLDNGESKMTGTAGQKRLPKDFVERHPFPLPPLAEQHRIVAKVDELMALCDRLEARQQDAETAHDRLVQALLDSLTHARDADEFQVRWQRLAEQFETLFANENSMAALRQAVIDFAASGMFGQGDERVQWRAGRLGDLVEDSGSGWSPSCEPRPRADVEWGVLKVSAVSWGTFQADENKALPANLAARPEFEVKPGDFLISRANTAELVARSVFVEATPPRLMLSDKIVRLRLSAACDPRFVQLANSSTAARRYYAEIAGGTSSSMKNVTRAQILALPIKYPGLVEQRRIVAKVTELLALCDQLKLRIAAVRTKHRQLADALVAQAVAI